MRALSGFWLQVHGSTHEHPGAYAAWDSAHQERYTSTGANQMISAPVQTGASPPREDDILHDPAGPKGVTPGPNGAYRTTGSSCQFAVAAGDVAVAKVE